MSLDGALCELTRQLGVPLSVFCFLTHCLVFHAACAAFAYIDRHKLLRRYKEHNSDRRTYRDMLPLVVLNQAFLLLPVMYAAERAGLAFQRSAAQPALHVLANTAWMTLGHDVFFYLGHRFLLHTPFGYVFFRHDVHHSTKASVALSSMYMAPSDYVLEIIVPYLVPLCMIRSDAKFNVLAIALGSLGGMYEHSGFNFWPRMPGLSTLAHSMHHARYNCSFSDGVGSSNIMDEALRTSYHHVYPKWRGKLSAFDVHDKSESVNAVAAGGGSSGNEQKQRRMQR